jgi:UDP-N-acetylmuramate--alanine ligase
VRDLLEDFARAFNHATEVLVTPIYKAGETPIPDIDHHRMASLISDFGHRHVGAVDSLDELVERLAPTLGPGDVVITLGAGDVNRALSEIAERLRARG